MTEDALRMALNRLSLQQTDELLEGFDSKRPISAKATARIKGRIMQKAGFHRLKAVYYTHKALVLAASLAIVLAAVVLLNLNPLVAAIDRFFNFIPGYGIQENNAQILYALKDPVTAESETAVLTVTNAVATKDGVTVYLTLDRKASGAGAAESKQEKSSSNGQPDDSQNIRLTVDGRQYVSSWRLHGSGYNEVYELRFDVRGSSLTGTSRYTLAFSDYHIHCDFLLVPTSHFDFLDEIGPTQMHNNIWLTATSSLQDGRLRVELYPVNKTGYTLIGFKNLFNLKPYGKDLYLQTDKGDKSYTAPDLFGINYCYDFDVSDGAQGWVLKTPGMIVQSNETQDITLPIPDEGTQKAVNKKIRLKDATVTITSVTQATDNDGHKALKINLSYQNAHENQQLIGVDFARVDSNGHEQSCGYSIESDASQKICAIDFDIEKQDGHTLKLRLDRPQYVFTDEYSLALNQSR